MVRLDWTLVPLAAWPFLVIARGEAVRAAGFTADPGRLLRRLPETDRRADLVRRSDLGEITRALRAYLAGELTAIDAVPVDQPGPGLFQRGWTALRAIRAGTTTSYQDFAALVGGVNPRTAGTICATNHAALFVPCHRVVAADGRLHGYAWGLPVKRWLLDHELGTPRLF